MVRAFRDTSAEIVMLREEESGKDPVFEGELMALFFSGRIEKALGRILSERGNLCVSLVGPNSTGEERVGRCLLKLPNCSCEFVCVIISQGFACLEESCRLTLT